MERTMKNEFTEVVPDLITRYPGFTAKEYAKMAIAQGLCERDSQNSLLSLQATLIKEYREGRMPQIKIVKVDRKTRYFPANNLKSAMRTYFRLAARLEVTKVKRRQVYL